VSKFNTGSLPLCSILPVIMQKVGKITANFKLKWQKITWHSDLVLA